LEQDVRDNKKLRGRCTEHSPPKDWYVIPGADHNNTYEVGGGAYFRRLGEFIRKALTI
jgi:hypothetical protein